MNPLNPSALATAALMALTASAFAQTTTAPTPDGTVVGRLAALADTGWLLGIGQALGRDDNPLHQPPLAQPMADTLASTSVDGLLKAAAGRQRWSAFGRIERTRHEGSALLDHTAHRAWVAWDFEAAGEVSGRLLARRQFDLAPDDLRLDPVTGQRNEQRIQQGLLQLRWRAAQRLSVEALRQHDRVEETAAWSALRNFRQDTTSLGLLWRARGPWEAGLAWREVQGRQPAGTVESTAPGGDAVVGLSVPEVDVRQRLMDLQLRWNVPERGSLGVRASHGNGHRRWARSDANASDPAATSIIESDQDLRSTALEGRWQWSPAWSGSFRWLRDQGQQARVLEPLTATSSLAALSATESDDRRLQLQWQPWVRLGFTVGVSRTQRRWQEAVAVGLDGRPIVLNGGGWEDRTQRTRLGAQWALGRAWALRCAAGRDHRQTPWALEGGGAPVPGSMGYRSRTVECGLRWEGGRSGLG